jgi:trehalose 6-phosphate synthase/phosphatase
MPLGVDSGATIPAQADSAATNLRMLGAPTLRGRLITVSNRLPVTITSESGRIAVKRSVGGLATGLRRIHSGQRSLWIGWPGQFDDATRGAHDEAMRQLAELHNIPVALSPREVSVFYEEVSNAVLWPVFHDRIDRLPLRMAGWDTYESVNQRYADAVVEHWRPDDVIWVHDYQLLRAPLLIRRRLPEATIGFFLHIPFPNPEIFFTLPVRKWLMEGMLGADLIGFHTRRYRGHFTAALRRLFGISTDASTREFAYADRKVGIGAFPMGIDAANFAEEATRRDVTVRVLEFERPNLRLLVGIDRLDYSKGIERRLSAYQRLLATHSEWRGRIRLVQVAVPSRGQVPAYQRLRKDVESLVGHINGEFGTPSWTPIHYIHRAVSPVTLLALYRAADVMLVTPLRDGMNLVAKEFVASRGDEDGVLILSEFAGAADELFDACMVNPYDVDGVAEAIHNALTMEPTERRSRMRRLRGHVFGHDVYHWAEEFLDTLAARRC